MSLYAAAVPPVMQALDRAGHLVDRIAASDRAEALLSATLAPDMFSCAAQLRVTAGFALRSTFPLVGRRWTTGDHADDLPGLRARLGEAAELVGSLEPADFEGAEDRPVSHRAGEADLVQPGTDYLHLFALPNLWFHLAMAYAILRGQGLEIGKADFDGWHAYAPGFRFAP